MSLVSLAVMRSIPPSPRCLILVDPMFWRISDINNIVGGIDHATFSALSPVAAWSGHSVTLVTDIGYSM